MKRFTIPCNFGPQKAPFHISIGSGPAPGCHPLKYQQHWLKTERGGIIPADVIESFEKLRVIATENGVSFEEPCVYALGTPASPTQEPPIESGLAASREEEPRSPADANEPPVDARAHVTG